MLRQSAIEFMFVPHKSDTIFWNVDDAWLNFPFFPLYAHRTTLFHPCQKPNNFPFYCCDTQHLLLVAANIISLFKQRIFLTVITLLPACPACHPTRRCQRVGNWRRGWLTRREVWNDPGVRVREITHQMLDFSRIKIRI